MSIKKILTGVLLIAVCGISLAYAGEDNDFSKDDYQNLLKGCKNMAGAQLEGGNFAGMDLSGVNFKGAELDRTNFQKANLSNANFTDADLDDANLKGANISGAIFKNAELEYATWIDGRVCAEGSIGGCW